MNFLKIANILRYMGGGIIIIGVFQRIVPLWIVGIAIMLVGSIWRLQIKIKESKKGN